MLKIFLEDWTWWFMPVILVIWEVKIKKMKVQGQPRQKAHETSS
jgi:hypothetical protein